MKLSVVLERIWEVEEFCKNWIGKRKIMLVQQGCIAGGEEMKRPGINVDS
jgi:hypothetical protein